MNVLFLGTPEFAVPTLERLARSAALDIHVLGVICQPDRVAGREGALRAPAVKPAALRLGLPVYQPERIKSDEAYTYLAERRPDALVVVAYGQIIPRRVFELPPLGTINAHASLLPKYRGAAPIQWAIANGERATGVTTMRIDQGLDTGDMLLVRETAIAAAETAPELSQRLSLIAAELMVETLVGLRDGSVRPRPQDAAQATLAPLLTKADGLVDWSWTAQRIYDRWRGFQPWPGIYSRFRGHQLLIRRCRVLASEANLKSSAKLVPGTLAADGSQLAVACGDRWLALDEVQLEGRARVTGVEFARGARLEPDSRLG